MRRDAACEGGVVVDVEFEEVEKGVVDCFEGAIYVYSS